MAFEPKKHMKPLNITTLETYRNLFSPTDSANQAYLDSTAEVGGTFIYRLGDDELRIVSAMLASQPSLPEIELRVFRRTN